MLGLIFFVFLFLMILGSGIRLAWNLTKFAFGFGLFWICPLLFVLIVLLGGFSHMWLPIIILSLLCGRGFRRI